MVTLAAGFEFVLFGVLINTRIAGLIFGVTLPLICLIFLLICLKYNGGKVIETNENCVEDAIPAIKN